MCACTVARQRPVVMLHRVPAAWGIAAAMVMMAAPAAAADPALLSVTRARTDYLLHCSGCHGQNGAGHPAKGIPRFTGQIGHFARQPEARAFLLQVPGLLSAGLSDERAAAVTTWLVREFAGTSLPTDFKPFTADEARRARESRPADIAARRHELYEKLVADGYPLD